MTDTVDFDTIASIARAARDRVRWEMEFGTAGYPKSSPVRIVEAPTGPAGTVDPPGVTQSKNEPAKTEPGLPTVEPVPTVEPGLPAVESKTAVSDAKEDAGFALEALRSALGECTRCNLHRNRTNLVFGEGNPNAQLVFVGEGPGRDEDIAGRPFVGVAGQLLDRIIEAMGLQRSEVYICNVVKCRPPQNRTPDESESNICGPFLRRQLAVIRPKVIVALGGTAAAYLLGGPQAITRIRGRFHTVDGIPMMPTFHPAYLLRNPAEKRAVWNDMQLVMDALGLERKKK